MAAKTAFDSSARARRPLIMHFDCVRVVVRHVTKGLLRSGFVEEKSVVISSEVFARSMGVEGIEGELVSLR